MGTHAALLGGSRAAAVLPVNRAGRQFFLQGFSLCQTPAALDAFLLSLLKRTAGQRWRRNMPFFMQFYHTCV